MLDAPREAAHQRLDAAKLFGTMEIAKIRGRERFFGARAVSLGATLTLDLDALGPRGDGQLAIGVGGRARAVRPSRPRLAMHECGSVRRQEIGVEQRVEASPFIATRAQQRLEAPAKDVAIEHADSGGSLDHGCRIVASHAESVRPEKTGKTC